jgi:hypothetical protein
MTAREKFKRGDRVTATEEGLRTWMFRRRETIAPPTGVVVGFGRSVELVRIRLDSRRTGATSWHMDFWEVGLQRPQDVCENDTMQL